MIVLVYRKNKEHPIAKVFTTLYINFSDVQGHITPESVVVYGRNMNTPKLSCMSLLPERMHINQKMKKLE